MKLQFSWHRFFLLLRPAFYALLTLFIARFFFFLINRADLPAGNDRQQWYWILLYGLRSDLIVCMALVPLFFIMRIVYAKWPTVWCRTLVIWSYVLIILCLAAISFTDAIFFNGNHHRLTTNDLSFFNENKGLLLPYAKKFWWLLIALILVCAGAFRIARQWLEKYSWPGLARKYRWAGYIAYFLFFSLLIFDTSSRHFFTPSSGYFVMKSEYVPFSANTPGELLASERYSRLDISKWVFMDNSRAFTLHPVIHSVYGKGSGKKNIVLFIMESASRHDFLENDDRKFMLPFLDSLMRRSLVYDNFFSNALESPAGFDAIIGGLPEGFAPDFFMTGYGYNKTQWVTGILKEHGYNTNFFYGVKDFSYSFLKASKNYQLDNDFGYRNYITKNKDYDGYYGVYDHAFFPAVANELNKLKTPFFSVIYNVSTHAPYNLIPESILDTLPVFKQSNGRALRYYDNVMRNFFSMAGHQPWFSNTVFVFVGDHFSRATDANGQSAVDIYSIPMFIYSPDGSYSGHSGLTGQQIDIPETLLHIAGIQTKFFSYGRSLFDSSGRRPAFNRNRAILQAIDSEFVLQYNSITGKIAGYYDYKKDPLLADNIYNACRPQADSLLIQLLAFWQVYAVTLHENKMHPEKFPLK